MPSRSGSSTACSTSRPRPTAPRATTGRQPGRHLHQQIETPEFRQALEFERQVWASGVCHPDSLTQTSDEVREQLIAGTVGSGSNAFILLPLIRGEAAKIVPDAQVDGPDPAGPRRRRGRSTYKIARLLRPWACPASLAGDDARIEELLRVTNYFGAPFGSEEYIFLNYGLEGIHHTVNDDGSRTLTQQGTEEVLQPLARRPQRPLQPEPGGDHLRPEPDGRAECGSASPRPTIGLYSPTAAARRPSVLTQLYSDRKIEIATGRADMSALDQLD